MTNELTCYKYLITNCIMWFIDIWICTLGCTSYQLVEQELFTLPEHLSSTQFVLSGDLFTRSLFLYVCFADRCLSFCTFSFGSLNIDNSVISDVSDLPPNDLSGSLSDFLPNEQLSMHTDDQNSL
jgi:hypothetical protein